MTVTRSNFHFIVPVWGEAYTELFNEVCLPLLLTENNLQCFKDDDSALFVIATTYKDAQAVRASTAFANLEKHVRVRIILIDALIDLRNSHRAMSDCYQLAMKLPWVKRGTTSFVFLTPDSFWSDGTFRRLYELSERGVLVVMVAGLRVNLETVRPILTEVISRNPANPKIADGDLVQIALANLHSMSLAHNWLGGDQFLEDWPSHVYFLQNHECLFAHAFHLHPLLVRSPRRRVRIRTTVDGTYLSRIGYQKSNFHVVCDSEEMLGIELSSKKKSWNLPLSQPNLRALRKFAIRHASPIHWEFFKYRIYFRANPAQKTLPEVVELADRILRIIRRCKPLSLVYYYTVTANPIVAAMRKGKNIMLHLLRRLGLFRWKPTRRAIQRDETAIEPLKK